MQPVLDAAEVIFIDDAAAKTTMMTTTTTLLGAGGWWSKFHHCHWHTETFVAAIGLSGVICATIGPRGMTGSCFLSWITAAVCKQLGPGKVVVINNLAAHKVNGIRRAIEATGAKLLYLPSLQPGPQPGREGLQQGEDLPAATGGVGRRTATGSDR